ncbi:MAG: DUF6817 domain-containing protein [Fibrobacteria bacterium]
MVDYAAINEKLSALKELGVGEFAHLNGSLETHLLGTYELLREWNNPGYVCDAGLYHAVYGTQPMERLGIPHKEYSPSDRPKIREIIGEESEQLVYFYAACDRDFFYPQIGSSMAQYRDRFTGNKLELPLDKLKGMLEITMANELEICMSGPLIKEKNRIEYIELFSRFTGLVSAEAFSRYQDVFDGRK